MTFCMMEMKDDRFEIKIEQPTEVSCTPDLYNQYQYENADESTNTHHLEELMPLVPAINPPGRPPKEPERIKKQKLTYKQVKIRNESPEQREVRLRKMREKATLRRQSETAEEREVRLMKMREHAEKRRRMESSEERAMRLAKMRENAEKRRLYRAACRFVLENRQKEEVKLDSER